MRILVLAGRMRPKPKPYPAEFRSDVVAVALKARGAAWPAGPPARPARPAKRCGLDATQRAAVRSFVVAAVGVAIALVAPVAALVLYLVVPAAFLISSVRTMTTD